MSGSRCPSREEADAIIGQARDEHFAAFCLCAMWSGMRLSEVASLEPQDVVIAGDDRPARLRVQGKRLAGDPGPRIRTALLYPLGVVPVRFVKHEVLGERHPRRLLFVTSRGNRWERQQVDREFARMCRAAGVEGVTFHGLRKFFGTWLLDEGVPELDVAVALGHFKRDGRPHVELVREVYGWPSVERALERLEVIAG